MVRTKMQNWMLCAMFAALTGILTHISIPLWPVPLNMATFSVMAAGALLGWKYGALSQLIYLLVGLAGVPVFSNFRSGPAHLLGPTGGYIWGYILAALVVGLLTGPLGRGARALALSMLAGVAVYFLLGTFWYWLYARMSQGAISMGAALMVCVVPFLPGDLVKIAAATALVRRLDPLLARKTA